jgi:hypothetical protein
MARAGEANLVRTLSKKHPKHGMVSPKESDHGLLEPLSLEMISLPVKSRPAADV